MPPPAGPGLEAVADWLLNDAIAAPDLLELFDGLVRRLAAAGFPLDRASLHIGTLHPQVVGMAWNWSRDDALCDEVRVGAAAAESPAYRRNPLYHALDLGETCRIRPLDPGAAARFPIAADLAARGIADYLALPLRSGGVLGNAATIGTCRPAGFAEADLSALAPVLKLLALHVERHTMMLVAANVLDVYLGPAAGRQVLAGTVARGAGAPVRAVIWVSDLRGFTDLTERLDGLDMIALLNAYFEALAGAVVEAGGEVLKFMGDGLLAVFPLAAFAGAGAAAGAALAAAGAGLAAVEALNRAPPPRLAAVDGWAPLRSGIALHLGDVFFGNVGAAERLDFTVIGPAVNAAARVEALCKPLGQALLVTAPVAALLDDPGPSLGHHALRGFPHPVEIFAPAAKGGRPAAVRSANQTAQ
ncbi:adenylate/guanylate cyclase domain-containing protein [Zavarzinia compransoris]|uniref:Adenylate/guanylate cyclase domain-containing protein n=1 Tax=Zavarzinia compransoris TaxID=1264899 RepID=A0A317DTH7_9PROT|nr:adenylate/guanylate cyclase domain-containing protein [Zavarzinia compransoris]PWR17997.1 adenylate/guanylate cyclase domain-containing protein [Zavarzinia compransoris]TDP43540.1 adenylate cyclase [Zavarzinia compransoris]